MPAVHRHTDICTGHGCFPPGLTLLHQEPSLLTVWVRIVSEMPGKPIAVHHLCVMVAPWPKEARLFLLTDCLGAG